MPFCGQVPSPGRAWEAPGAAGEREGQEPCPTTHQGPWAAGLAILAVGAEHPACPGASGEKQLGRSVAGWGCVSCCVSCCGTPVPCLLTWKQWSVPRGSGMHCHKCSDPVSLHKWRWGWERAVFLALALAMHTFPIRCRDQMGFCRLRGVKRL